MNSINNAVDAKPIPYSEFEPLRIGDTIAYDDFPSVSPNAPYAMLVINWEPYTVYVFERSEKGWKRIEPMADKA